MFPKAPEGPTRRPEGWPTASRPRSRRRWPAFGPSRRAFGGLREHSGCVAGNPACPQAPAPGVPACPQAPAPGVSYLLNPAHRYGASKARFFAPFGFRVEAWEVLAVALREYGHQNEVARVRETGFGPRYAVEGELEAPDGRRP